MKLSRQDSISVYEHMAALQTMRDRFDVIVQGLRDDLAAERDRRYAEVSVEREKALKIKEVADLAALQLAREIQTYKDEKANELREQINSERGHYASKDDLGNVTDKLDAAIKPIVAYMNATQGQKSGIISIWGYLVALASIAIAVIALATR